MSRYLLFLFSALLAGEALSGMATPSAAATLHVPSEYEFIQDAVWAAVEGDTVLVASGVYGAREDAELIAVVVDGAIVLRSEAGADATIIDGGGERVVIQTIGDAVVEGFTIRNGYSQGHGGGIYCLGGSPRISECRIIECEAGRDGNDGGGGIYLSESSARIESCFILGNSGSTGGGVRSVNSAATLVDCVIGGNHAFEYFGGGVSHQGSEVATLEGCTIVGNVAATQGGGLFAHQIVAERTIISGNCAASGPDLWLPQAASLAEFTCSAIDSSAVDGPGTLEYGVNSVHSDPRICRPPVCWWVPSGGFDYTLSDDSPCRAENSPCGERIGALDVGCSEPELQGACCLGLPSTCTDIYQIECEEAGGFFIGDGAACVLNPCPGACCLPDDSCVILPETECVLSGGYEWRAGFSCDPPACPEFVLRVPGDFPGIQEAIDAAFDGDTVLVSAGRYPLPEYASFDFLGKEIALRSVSGPEETILDGEYRWAPVVQLVSGEGPGSRIEGFTITGGRICHGQGAGIRLEGASPTIENCVIVNNTEGGCIPEPDVGGIAILDGSFPRLVGCTIADNEVHFEPVAGVYCSDDSGAILERCILWGNCGAQLWVEEGAEVYLDCCAVSFVHGSGSVVIDRPVEGDPELCDPTGCTDVPIDPVQYRVASTSPCIPANSPCGELVGALGIHACSPSGIGSEEPAAIPGLVLSSAIPNPSRGIIRLEFELPSAGTVQIDLFDVRGSRVGTVVESGTFPAGRHQVEWNTRSPGIALPTGLYFARLQSGERTASSTVLVVH